MSDSLPAGPTMAELLRAVADRNPGRPALHADGLRLNYAELDARTDRVAQALAARGWGRGATIGVLAPDGVAVVELLVATAKLGATLLALNWRLSAGELAYIVGDARPNAIIVASQFADLLAEADPAVERLVIPHGGNGLALALDVDAASPRLPRSHAVDPGDRWYMLYTSGTTGAPKGCQHSQAGYYLSTTALAGFFGLSDRDSQLVTAPLFHVGGLQLMLATLAAGACTVLPPRSLDLAGLVRLVADEGITMQSTPVLGADQWLDLIAQLDQPTKLRMLVGAGGLNPDAEWLARIERVTGADILLGYGQSEVGGFITFSRLSDAPERFDTCGRVLSHLRVRIVGPDGADQDWGGTGELLVRGPSVTMGYHNRPEATAAAFAGGWLRTGDIVRTDREGFVYFAGRVKELVKTGGENVYPAEVEKVLARHPSVAECCVIGVPDPRFGEAVKAVIVLRPGATATPREIADFCRGSIANYKRPRYVEFTAQILRNYQGKPQRTEMARLPVTPDQHAFLVDPE